MTATLSHPSSAAAAGDYALSSAMALIIAAGSVLSAGLVTSAAVGNDVNAADKTVMVSAENVANDRLAADSTTRAVMDATLTDDDEKRLRFAPLSLLGVAAGASAGAGYAVALTSMPEGTAAVDSDAEEVKANPAA